MNASITPQSSQKIHEVWNHAEDLTVEQAAALLAGFDPAAIEAAQLNCAATSSAIDYPSVFPGYLQAKSVLVGAINAKKLNAKIRRQGREYGVVDEEYDSQAQDTPYDDVRGVVSTDEGEILDKSKLFFFNKLPDWSLTTISKKNLVMWLENNHYRNTFFVVNKVTNDDFLDPQHERYAPRLAAAVSAWTAVAAAGSGGVLKALEAWLTANAHQFKDGKGEGLGEKAKKECARVANWNFKGGAPRAAPAKFAAPVAPPKTPPKKST